VAIDRDRGVRRTREVNEAAGAPKADIKARVDLIPDSPYGNGRSFGPGWITYVTSEPFTEEEVAIAGRFADVFAIAYTRFRELKEKEDQNRELTIQNALERVRAKAQGMQVSDEIAGVAKAIYDEFQGLGYAVDRTSVVVEPVQDIREVWIWTFSQFTQDLFDLSDAELSVRKPLRRTRTAAGYRKYLDRRRKGDLVTQNRLEGRRLFKNRRYIGANSGLLKGKVLEVYVNRQPQLEIQYFVLHTNGNIIFHCTEELSEADLLVAKRFTDVFDYAYDRFRELKVKEDQNRELTIQNALERVRAKAQGMQESDEIAGVAKAIYDACQGLGFGLIRCGVNVLGDEATLLVWMFGEGRQERWGLTDDEMVTRKPDVYQILPDTIRLRREALRKGNWYYRQSFEGQALFDRRLSAGEQGGFAGDELEVFINREPHHEDHCYVLHSHGSISFAQTEPMSEADLLVAKRFTDVFDYAYDRFHELMEKEDQNRELTIQNALERVRAMAQGMQVSDEIAGVAKAIYDEFLGLGYELVRANVVISDDESDSSLLWGFGPELRDVFGWTDEELNLRKPILWPRGQGTIQDRLEARARGEWYYVTRVEGEALQETRKRALELHGIKGKAADAIIKSGLAVEFRHSLMHANGLINFVTAEELPEADLRVARRFTDVFDYGYDRFRELKEKEAQNRELRVQNSLEHIRTRALGMQESDDLYSVTNVLHEQMAAVGIQSIVTSIEVVDRENGMFRTAAMLESVEMTDWEEITMASFQAIRAHNRMLEAYDRGDDVLVTRLEGEECREHQQFWIEKLFESNPEARDLGYPDQSSVSFALFFFSRGWIFLELGSTVGDRGEPGFQLIEGDPLSEEEQGVVKRFAKMFDFAYSRFLELKEKEDQNRELTIQNALEQVRARALGMQESGEIMEVARLNWEVMTGLGFDLLLSSIFFRSEDSLEFYSVEDPESPGFITGEPTFYGHYVYSELNEEENAAWDVVGDLPHIREAKATLERGGRQLSFQVEGQDAQAWYHAFLNAMFTERDKEEALARLPAVFSNLRYFIDHGGPSVDSTGVVEFFTKEPFNDEQIAIGRRFADVFEFAYSRFRELKAKEEQARAADQRAAVDRVSAEAAGMEGTEDIANVVKALWEALQGQNVDYDFLSMEVIDEDANLLQAYAAIPDDSQILSLLAMEAQPGARRERVVDKLIEGVGLLRSEISLSDALEAGFSKADLSRTVLTDSVRDGRSAFLEKVWGLSPSAERRPSVKAVRAGFNHGSINLYTGIHVQITNETIALVEALGEAVSLGFARYWDFRALEEKNRALEQANEEVRAATAMKSQFLASMSHELRTQMNAIIGFTRLVLRRSDNLVDRQRDNLEKVSLSANHLLILINDILDLSKVEAGKVDLNPTDFNLPLLLEGCCATVGPTYGKSTVEMVCKMGEGVGEIYGDEDRLRQIVTNLLSNALKFTDEGEVRVEARIQERGKGRIQKTGDRRQEGVKGGSQKQMLAIAVSDTGIGIPEEMLGLVFEEFHQVEGGMIQRQKGTGLGLAITKRLVELMGGSIGVTSEVGKGSVFTVEIPVVYQEGNE